MAVRLHGLASCDRCRRAHRCRSERGIEADFVDLARDGLDPGTLDRWLGQVGWEQLLNHRSTTRRGLPPERRGGLDHAAARALLLEAPRRVKRPVLEAGEAVAIGFDTAAWERVL